MVFPVPDSTPEPEHFSWICAHRCLPRIYPSWTPVLELEPTFGMAELYFLGPFYRYFDRVCAVVHVRVFFPERLPWLPPETVVLVHIPLHYES